METLNLKVLKVLRKECSCASGVEMYMKHIIIRTDSRDLNCRKALKEEIVKLIHQHFPKREESLPFIITGGELKDENFYVERKITV